MASSSRQVLRPSNQNAQNQYRQSKPLQSSNVKSIPAILSRKRKYETFQMVSIVNLLLFVTNNNSIPVKYDTLYYD